MFSEPGIFLIRSDRTVYYLSVQSVPFVRPNFSEMLQALGFIIKQDYPARAACLTEGVAAPFRRQCKAAR